MVKSVSVQGRHFEAKWRVSYRDPVLGAKWFDLAYGLTEEQADKLIADEQARERAHGRGLREWRKQWTMVEVS